MARSLQIICGLLLTATAATAAPRPVMPPLRVVGNQVLAGNQPLHLRGINWGWWKLSGTRYEEADMRNMAGWGANFARLAFSAEMLENEERPGTWNEAGFRDLDAVVQWGRRYGVYVALDMHVIPGGQNTSHYTAGGKNQFWKDPACQERFLALWRELARRYKGHPEVAAYELMNEPETAGKITPEELRALYQRTIAAIRAVDPDKIIVVPGDHYSGANSLTDALALPEQNIFYTFHFYNPSQLTHQSPPPGIGYPSDAAFAADAKWLRNVKDGSGINGTRDWVRMEERFTPGTDATAMGFMLRSSNNSGSAWFDEVRLETADGKTIFAESFDQGKSAFQPERFPENAMSFDA
ncbi:MAG TPA: glycoside hydrolase family 5 protein, partial [Armatimonadota bacterium]|nr:glycoside hydrolase family 5 protein [Armatimonadota bacterium]